MEVSQALTSVEYSAMSWRPEKATFPAIWPRGFHRVLDSELDKYFAEPFQDSTTRRQLVGQLRLLIGKFRSLGLSGELWIDGSFVTRKPGPKDIDVVFVVRPAVIESLGDAEYAEFERLSAERLVTRRKYGSDLFVISSEDLGKRKYFTDLFSRNPDADNPKGIAVVNI